MKYSYKKFILYFLLWMTCIILCIIIGWSYVSVEHKVWYTDYFGYWNQFQNVTNNLIKDPISTIKNIYIDTRFANYNPTPILLPSFLGIIFGTSRISYIIILLCLYIVPISFLVASLIIKICELKSIKFFILLTIMTLLFTPFWVTVLRGIPDICGLIPIILAIIIVYKSKLSFHLEYGKDILLGLLLYTPFLLRRWYAYTILALFFTLPIYNLFKDVNAKQLMNNKLSLRNLRYIFINYFLVGLSTICFLILLQYPLAKNIISTNYSLVYSAYQLDSFRNFLNTLHQIGVLWPLFSLLAFCLIMYKGNYNKKIFSIFCLVTLILTYIFFTMTQALGMHHCLPLVLWIWFIILLGLTEAYKLLRAKFIIISLVILFMGCSFVYSLISPKNYSIYNLPLLSKCNPIQVKNYHNYKKFAEFLENLAPGKIAVFASSAYLCSDTLKSLSDGRLSSRIINVSGVDLRDGFRLDTLMTRYVVITEKPAIHLPINHQRVIVIPQNSIINGQNIGKAYKEIGKTYILANGIKAKIYEKYRGFTSEEVSEFIDILCKAYPDWRSNLEKDAIKLNMFSQK